MESKKKTLREQREHKQRKAKNQADRRARLKERGITPHTFLGTNLCGIAMRDFYKTLPDEWKA